jgi:putative phosphoribosyl transferase
MIYADRRQAGILLSRKLGRYAKRHDVILLALPRGGVPVGFELAMELSLPIDVFVVRKLGVPEQKELAMGAIASGGVRVLNHAVIEGLGISDSVVDRVTAEELLELKRRESVYRGSSEPPQVADKVAILVDDGLATGATMRAGVQAVRKLHPKRVVVAAPVAARSTWSELGREADEVVCDSLPEPFYGVGEWYDNFEQTRDEEVFRLLSEARRLYPVPVTRRPALF